ncbi:MAG: 30S ribosomal protein S5 [Dehalococcoidia bacterium]|jgi:small subunit ribosomal protein S5|nr:30S ribosomal protein S5 [Chloroflexota bacterium]OUW95918.1 MAG: 30S ribosomal protein S5 [Chloroflexi bacterium TMED230]RZP13091.1 MAG: 30S ribosomal protein S5 [Chloroflexota bacterium]|tara:strand:- start:11498 stop:12067 length:570 start_codon:yes stop_codon:yes gene_type:complete
MTTNNKTQDNNNQNRNNQNRNNPNRRNSRSRRNRDNDEFSLVENVIKIRRVSKTVKGGRNLSFNAMVAVGDGAGRVGIALASASAVPDAVQRAVKYAKERMINVTLNNTTLPHESVIKFGSSKVMLKPAAPGTGLIAGGGVRAVLEAVGVKDVVSKTFGSTNAINVVYATMEALKGMKNPKKEISKRRA